MPTPSPSVILDPQKAVEYTINFLLSEMDSYWGFDIDSPDWFGPGVFMPVTFPHGEHGSLVAVPCGGGAGGFKLLFRIRGDKVELVQQELDVHIYWGVKSLNPLIEGAEGEYLSLVTDTNGRPVQSIKLNGSSHQGTGIGENGHFQIINITDSGMQVIFEGASEYIGQAYLPGDWDYVYQYQYLSVKGDRNKQILKTGEECQVRYNNKVPEKFDCKSVKTLYKYNGEKYVEFKPGDP